MLRYALLLILGVFACRGFGQSYADSPFYKPSPPAPSTANHTWIGSPNAIEANGISIDLSESGLNSEKLAGFSTAQQVDGTNPAQVLHFYVRFENLNVVFAYNLLVEKGAGTGKIKCTFSALTQPENPWGWNDNFTPVPLSEDLTPIVIESRDTVEIDLLPLGPGGPGFTEYIHLKTAEADAAAVPVAAASITPAVTDNDAQILLAQTAENYKNLTGYTLHAQVALQIPDTARRYTGEVTLFGAHRQTLEDGTVKVLPGGGQISCCKLVSFQGENNQKPTGETPPAVSAPLQIFGHFEKMTDDAIRVQRMGAEVLQLNGRDVSCDVLLVTYTPSTFERTHPEQVT